jgi:major membrane immunogen (membrane-anchored lipoprotein)
MKKSLLTGIVALSLVFAACSSSDDETAEKPKDKYEITKESLEETEKKNAKRFLSVEGHDKKNLIRQTVIKGTISNSAKVVTYKDIDIELTFYSKTGALLEKDHEVIYESVGPGSTANFKTKYYAPKGTDSVALRILSAKTE